MKDCFHVIVTGSIETHGLVEAAYLQSGRDMNIAGGMAGREKGIIKAGRDLNAKYLDNVTALVARDATIQKEIINSRLSTGRSFKCENGSVAGGTLIIAHDCFIGQVGTAAGTLTRIVLGRIAELADLATEAAELMPLLEARAEKAEEKLNQLTSLGGHMSPQQAEELTELQFEASQSRDKLTPLQEGIDRIHDIMDKYTHVNLVVNRRLFAGTRIWAGTLCAEFDTDLKGPIRIFMNEKGEFMIEDLTAKSVSPLSSFARVQNYDFYTGPKQACPPIESLQQAA